MPAQPTHLPGGPAPPQEFKRRNAPCLRWLAGLDLLGSLNLQVGVKPQGSAIAVSAHHCCPVAGVALPPLLWHAACRMLHAPHALSNGLFHVTAAHGNHAPQLTGSMFAMVQDYGALQRFEGYVQNDPDSIGAIRRALSCSRINCNVPAVP